MKIISNIIRFALLYILVLFLELCFTCLIERDIMVFTIYDFGRIYLNLPPIEEYPETVVGDGYFRAVPWVRFIENCCFFGTPLIIILIGFTVKRFVKFVYITIKKIGKKILMLTLFCVVSLNGLASTYWKNIPSDAKYVAVIDFSQPSGTKRFSIYDIKDKHIIHRGLVQHGNGGNSTKEKPTFSNKKGSNCSSLGLYKVVGYGKMNVFPIDCFRLRGLSKTNSNAEKRGIVIHPTLSPSLPFKMTYLPLTDESHGCFGVSFETMRVLSDLYKKGTIYLYAADGLEKRIENPSLSLKDYIQNGFLLVFPILLFSFFFIIARGIYKKIRKTEHTNHK